MRAVKTASASGPSAGPPASRVGRQAEVDRRRPASRDLQPVVRGGLRADAVRVHRVRAPRDDVLVERVLHPGRRVRRAEESRLVGLVVGEEQHRRAGRASGGGDPRDACSPDDRRRALAVQPGTRPVSLPRASPRPGVAKPERRQHVQRGRLGAAVGDGEADQDVVGRRLGVLGEDVEVAARRRTLRCRRARTPRRACRAGGSPRRAGRTETPRCGYL